MTNFNSILILVPVVFLASVSHLKGQRDLEAMKQLNPRMPPPMDIDEDRVVACGIQRIEAKHVVIYTDIRDREDINELGKVFDLGMAEMCEYFEVEPNQLEGWQLSAFVIQDKAKFENANLFPADLPEFPAGFNAGHHMWVYLQPGNYYTRHLLLHEGTHAFMQWHLGGSGQPWYSEGMAEMLGVHRWNDSELKLNYRLKSKEEAEYWGRVKIINEDVAADNALTLEQVLQIENVAFRNVRSYAWAWAACKFFSQHPLSKSQFDNLRDHANDVSGNFNRQFFRAVKNDWSRLQNDWELFITEMDYGIQVEQLSIFDAGAGEDGSSFSIDATRGWQKTKFQVEQGKTYRIQAKGRYQIANDGEPWACEPGGITIEYYRGQPLGMLMAGSVAEKDGVRGLIQQQPIGLEGEFTAEHDGILCFRVNESPANLDDNSGSLVVTISEN